jgi:hypothetical protein
MADPTSINNIKFKDVVIALETEAKQRTDYVLDNAAEAIKNLCEENNKLCKERDEARRTACHAEVNGQYGRRYTVQDIAKIKGWDCFKENING